MQLALPSREALPGKGRFQIASDETVAMLPPGRGGCGDPKEPPPELVKADLVEGRICAEEAGKIHGHNPRREWGPSGLSGL